MTLTIPFRANVFCDRSLYMVDTPLLFIVNLNYQKGVCWPDQLNSGLSLYLQYLNHNVQKGVCWPDQLNSCLSLYLQYLMLISYGTKSPLCVDVPLDTYLFTYTTVENEV